jgi:hypothetical protein
VDQTLAHYRDIAYVDGYEPVKTSIEFPFPGVDLVVILGNAVNGSAWDGYSSTYFQDRWDSLMNVIINYSPARVAYTLGNLDALGNLQDPKKIIQYVNAYQGLSMTFLAPDSIEGYTFYGIPVHSSKCGNKPNAAPLLYLLFFDSNTEYCKRIRDDKDPTIINCISDTQI